jgi:predicted O-methyltransferase YrrM
VLGASAVGITTHTHTARLADSKLSHSRPQALFKDSSIVCVLSGRAALLAHSDAEREFDVVFLDYQVLYRSRLLGNIEYLTTYR